jgi:flagella basal body P-ring formation protein FlgA
MKLLVLVIFAALADGATLPPPSCTAIESSQIRAGDIAAALPEFAAVNPDTPLAAAPLPGVRRMLRPAELTVMARRNGIEVKDPAELCVEYRMEALDTGKVLEAMYRALGNPELKIEIVETSVYPVPRGLVEFPRDRLVSPATGRAPALWRGDVVYGAGRRFAIWARVVMESRQNRVVAAVSLKMGQPIEAAQLRTESVEGFPSTGVAESVEQVVGRVPSRPISAGTAIRLDQVVAAPEVRRGETVEIEVRAGNTRLGFSGKSESDGRRGDLIAVRNLTSNRAFQARVSGRGRAEIVLHGAEEIR